MTLKIYTHEGCPACDRAKKYLNTKKIPFTEINIKDNPLEAKTLTKKLTGKNDVIITPIICNKDKCIAGFNEKSVEDLLS